MSTSPRIGILVQADAWGVFWFKQYNKQGYQLAAAVERPESSLVGADAGELAGSLASRWWKSSEVFKDCDVVIDFTATSRHRTALETVPWSVAMVIGTTGMNDEQKAFLDETAATQTPVVYAANYSVGVNVSIKLLELAAKVFGDSVDIEIIEAHHRWQQVDELSGTAFMMGDNCWYLGP